MRTVVVRVALAVDLAAGADVAIAMEAATKVEDLAVETTTGDSVAVAMVEDSVAEAGDSEAVTITEDLVAITMAEDSLAEAKAGDLATITTIEDSVAEAKAEVLVIVMMVFLPPHLATPMALAAILDSAAAVSATIFES